MNKKQIFSAMLAGLLALGLVLAGCNNGTTGGDGSGGDQYTLNWAYFDMTYTAFTAIPDVATLTGFETGSNYTMGKGTVAENAFNTLSSTPRSLN